MNKEVQRYLDAVPHERKGLIDTLHTLILELYPQAEVTMKYKMPTYQVGDGWVALANQKNYVSLYTCGYHHIAPFKKKHPTIKTGKGCINLKVNDTIARSDFGRVVQHAMEHPKG